MPLNAPTLLVDCSSANFFSWGVNKHTVVLCSLSFHPESGYHKPLIGHGLLSVFLIRHRQWKRLAVQMCHFVSFPGRAWRRGGECVLERCKGCHSWGICGCLWAVPHWWGLKAKQLEAVAVRRLPLSRSLAVSSKAHCSTGGPSLRLAKAVSEATAWMRENVGHLEQY